jgi:hypothetical protein
VALGQVHRSLGARGCVCVGGVIGEGGGWEGR